MRRLTEANALTTTRQETSGKDAPGRICLGVARAFMFAAGALLGAQGAVVAQVDCSRLQAQIASAGRGNSGLVARYSAAAGKQQAEIARTAAYAASIGCNNRQFLFFGSAPPPQCGGLQARLQQMRANVAALQGQVQASSGEGQRRDLQARYDAYCRGGQMARGRGLFDSLFNNPEERLQVPIYEQRKAPRPSARDDDDDDDIDNERPRGGTQAVCVRTCDGGFFPMSYSARRGNLEDLEELCKALCPNVEAALYTYSASKNIDSAVSTEGASYSSLKNAGKYRTKFDPTCTCKPPHKSWVEALADAEALLDKRKFDIVVTEAQAAELSRAKGKPAAQPQASTAAIAGATKSYGLNDGQKREQQDSSGVRKKVRVIAPDL